MRDKCEWVTSECTGLMREKCAWLIPRCTWCMREKYASGADPGFGQRGPQVLRPKVADVAKWSCASEASK